MSFRLEEVQAQATVLADNLLDSAAFPCRNLSVTRDSGESCLQQEDARPLEKFEKVRGAVVRTFDNYDPDRMCLTCRAYWHTSMANNALLQALAIVAKYG